MKCPYCNHPAPLVSGDAIYPHRPDLYVKKFYLCKPCKAYVGCHQGTENPLGRLADADLRRAKVAAHAAFDPIWKEGTMSRSAAYAWLAAKLGVKPRDCHIGMFDVSTCEAVIRVCRILSGKSYFDGVQVEGGDPRGTLRNPDGSRSIFDDVDQ